jgi:hypothetical protein
VATGGEQKQIGVKSDANTLYPSMNNRLSHWYLSGLENLGANHICMSQCVGVQVWMCEYGNQEWTCREGVIRGRQMMGVKRQVEIDLNHSHHNRKGHYSNPRDCSRAMECWSPQQRGLKPIVWSQQTCPNITTPHIQGMSHIFEIMAYVACTYLK